MKPIFPKWTNKLPFIVLLVLIISTIFTVAFIWYYFSPKYTAVGYQPEQPIAFSHSLHAGELSLDCRYCHSTVEKTSFAALPTTSSCMGCHNKVKANSPRLAVLKSSFENNKPIEWVHVNFLPRYARFDHSAHVNSGVGCVSCHARVDTMETVYQAQPLSMGWCLECHNNFKNSIVPTSQITNMIYNHNNKNTFSNLYADGNLKADNNSNIQPPTACGACHY